MRSPRARPETAGRAAPTGPRLAPAAGAPAPPAAGAGVPVAGSVVWPVAMCIAWAVLALRSPQATYHLMPLWAAAAWPVAVRLHIGARLAPRFGLALAAGGLVLTLATAAALGAGGALGGPSLWHGSGALETPLAGLAGAGWGWRVATRSGRGIIARSS